ncbi:MAG: GIY-YIG nuclease family protein [Actinomycetia bacterium]|nr:GIY-YIG nuclease family protein [Actinomycetes bacterium]
MTANSGHEIVYVLTNASMPGLTKIGKTTQADMAGRMSQLYTAGVPVPFECVYACEVNDCREVEEALHTAFGGTRVNPNREFFRIEPERVVAVLRLLSVGDVTPQVGCELSKGLDSSDRQSMNVMKRNRRPNMNFGEMGISPGSELVYVNDGEVRVSVVDERRVNYNGTIVYLSGLTADLLHVSYPLQPSPYWTYEGRNLKGIYEETYADVE